MVVVHPAPHGLPAGQVDEQLGVVAAVRLELVDEAEIVEDLLGARLQALAAGAVERLGRLLDDPERDAAALQLAGQGEAGGSGADDEDEF